MPSLDRFREHDIDAVIGKLKAGVPLRGGELQAIVGRALDLGQGSLRVVDDRGESWILSEKLNCRRCSRGFEPLDPRLFSFNSRYGACTRCEGLGVVDDAVCPVCNGKRLREEALAVRVKGKGIAEITALSVSQAEEIIKSFAFERSEAPVAEGIVAELMPRFRFLRQVGLDYLTLDRSGRDPFRRRGAAHPAGCPARLEPHGDLRYPRRAHDRASPAGQCHADLDASGSAERGNSVIVVEHDEETIRESDWIVDLGPARGPWGAVSSPRERSAISEPRLGDGRLGERSPQGDHLPAAPCRRAHPAYNYRGEEKQSENISMPAFPWRHSPVSRASGSAKSTLVKEVLYEVLKAKLSKNGLRPVGYDQLVGWEKLYG